MKKIIEGIFLIVFLAAGFGAGILNGLKKIEKLEEKIYILEKLEKVSENFRDLKCGKGE